VNAVSSSMVSLPVGAEDAGWLLGAFAFAVGACVGSFLNVCIYRLPADESVVRPASRCPRCAKPIAWYDNIPLLSWAWLGARCRACRAPIPARYPLVEALTGGLAVLALARFGATADAAVAFVFTAALLLITFIDLDHRFIPDEVSLPGVVVGLAVSFLPGGVTPLDALGGVLLGGGVLWAVAWGYERLTGVEGMGYGDVKLLAMMGAFLGWQPIPAVLVIASITGSLAGALLIFARGGTRRARRVARRFGIRVVPAWMQRAARRTEIPFGPFLALGAVIAVYAPALTVPWQVIS
jgi:leader peptidase (prepilin peptidase) / N-methyltransferase